MPSSNSDEWFQRVLWHGNGGLYLESNDLGQLYQTVKAPFYMPADQQERLERIINHAAMSRPLSVKASSFGYFEKTDDFYLLLDRDESHLNFRKAFIRAMKDAFPDLSYSQWEPDGMWHISLFYFKPRAIAAEGFIQSLEEQFPEKPIILFDRMTLFAKEGNDWVIRREFPLAGA